MDGDGLDDLLIGVDYESSTANTAGAVYLVLGNTTGTVSLSAADAKFTGEAIYDFAGWSVSGTGDVDGDGLSDLLIGAPAEDSAGSSAGAAYLVSGGTTGTVSLSAADAKLTGEAAGDWAGGSVSSEGDVDGDGLSDLLIGAPYASSGSGSHTGVVYLVQAGAAGTVSLSAADARFTGEVASDFAGGSVSSEGDVDGDGLSDLLIGAHAEDSGGSRAGAAYLVFGGATGTVSLSAADAKFTGEAAGDEAGGSVSLVGDADGDGLDDLLIGAAHASAGAAYLVLGGATGTMSLTAADARFTGESSGDLAGGAVSGAGDVDGDGLSDLLIGARYEDSAGVSAGAAYLVLGGATGTISLSAADAKLTGEATGDEAGVSVSGAGDIDGDGLSEILVGAQYESSGFGAAYLYTFPMY